MKGVMFFFCGIVAIIFIALVLDIIWQSTVKHKKRFRDMQREKLRKRFPFLPHDKFLLRITQLSPCCMSMMWEYDNGFTLDFFCDNCGKRYRKYYSYNTKEFTEELDYLPYERDLSALNEFWKKLP